MIGCITYINEKTNDSIHTCQMCDNTQKVGDAMVIDGVYYIITKVVPEITNGKCSMKIYIR